MLTLPRPFQLLNPTAMPQGCRTAGQGCWDTRWWLQLPLADLHLLPIWEATFIPWFMGSQGSHKHHCGTFPAVSAGDTRLHSKPHGHP